ncbi:hypothetical protein CNMCM5623_007622 [Aspergillus felis]|uniref:60S ribosomal subunit assembly/export protein loc1 n=2 Tax=Aspergillus felis TaxID=1287682 RepID=A0A8H6PXH3_9EURO|nr:hypothetical protein CNMCM5623_007622 [Aspergillus felis]
MALEQQNINNTQLLDVAMLLKLLANLRPDCGYGDVQGSFLACRETFANAQGFQQLNGRKSKSQIRDRMTRDFASAQLTAIMNISSPDRLGVLRAERTAHTGARALREITDMAPNKPSVKGKSSSKGDSGKSKPLSSASKVSKKNAKRPPPKEVKSKARTESSLLKKTKKREYTEEELGLPKLNMITPVGVVKPKGKKKGKVFVDDQEGMMTILAMVNAEQEGHIESKLQKARQLEEIREAKRKEAEARHAEKKNKLEEVKQSIRQKRKGKSSGNEDSKPDASTSKSDSKSKGKRKSVSFA